MSTKRIKRERKKTAKQVSVFLVIQILILAVFGIIYILDTPFDPSELKHGTITVDRVDYAHRLVEGSVCSLYSGDTEYRFARLPLGEGEYSLYELYKSIQPGDTVSIIYEERSALLGTMNVILDARSGETVYRSLSYYTRFSDNNTLVGWIIFIIVELLWLIVFVIFLCFKIKNKHLKPQSKNKKSFD